MTKCKPFTPYNFSSFQHMLKNITFICEYLGGPHCLSATAWRSALQHATMNELAYCEEQQKEKLFYCSILNDYHRRFQTFLRSCAFAKAEKIKKHLLTFSDVHRTIDTFNYIVHHPIWIKKREQVDTRQQPNTDRDNKRQRYSQGRQNGDRIVNNDLDDQMRLPTNLKFGDVFKQANTGNAPKLNHADGSQRCHNFHHRGFC